jgi:hypothetical protein
MIKRDERLLKVRNELAQILIDYGDFLVITYKEGSFEKAREKYPMFDKMWMGGLIQTFEILYKLSIL